MPKSYLPSGIFAVLVGSTPCKPQLKPFYSSIYRGLGEFLHLIKAALEVRVPDGGAYLMTYLAELRTCIIEVLGIGLWGRRKLGLMFPAPLLLLFLSKRKEVIDGHGLGGFVEVHYPAALGSLEVYRGGYKLRIRFFKVVHVYILIY